MHTPKQQSPVTDWPVTADHFRLFLCHLYFPAHYRYPPYLPHDDVDLSDTLALHSLVYPPLVQAELSVLPVGGKGSGKLRAYIDIEDTKGEWVLLEGGVLALAHYFDCQRLLQRCKDVGLLRCAAGVTQQRLASYCATLTSTSCRRGSGDACSS